MAGTGVPAAKYVVVTSDKPLIILSAIALHTNVTDLDYQKYTPGNGSLPQFQPVDYANVAKLYRWDWNLSTFVPLPQSDWQNASVIDWNKNTVILTHGWNGSLQTAEYIRDFVQDFMVGRTADEREGIQYLGGGLV